MCFYKSILATVWIGGAGEKQGDHGEAVMVASLVAWIRLAAVEMERSEQMLDLFGRQDEMTESTQTVQRVRGRAYFRLVPGHHGRTWSSHCN